MQVIRGSPSTDKNDSNAKAKKRKEKLTEDQMKVHMQEVNNLKFVNMLLVRCYCLRSVPWATLTCIKNAASSAMTAHSPTP